MAGVIWFVQRVHYPLFRRANRDDFVAFALEHQRRTGPVVAPGMLAELLTGVALVFVVPEGVPAWTAWAGFGLILVNALSTAFVQMPLHEKLARDGYDARRIDLLVRTNWLRTVAWTARALLTTAMLWCHAQPASG